MSLLDQEVKKQEQPKGKKIVLSLLILSIILFVFAIIIMLGISGNKTKPLTLVINKDNVTIDNNLLINQDGKNYISISKIANLIGYEYLKGEYQQYDEDNTNTKFYLQNQEQVVQFSADSNMIYKVDLNSNLDYEEYKLENKILKTNNLLYIALDDLDIALNVVYKYIEKDNNIELNTVDELTESYKESLPKETNNKIITISDEFNNKKAIAYDMLVVSNDKGKWGVIDKNLITKIGNKYSSMEFIESAGVFIVSDNNKYGVVSKNATNPIIDLNYEKIEIINNSPVYYKVKLAGKYGIIDQNGKPIINNSYDSMGYFSNNVTQESVLVIEGLGTNNNNALVVKAKEKYGLVNLDNGETIIDCTLDKIYSKNVSGEKQYYIELQEQEISLDKYIEYLSTTTVNVGN